MNTRSKTNSDQAEISTLPVHSLDRNALQIQILPLDHTNPYDYKRKHRHSYYEIILIEKGGCNQLIDFIDYPGLDSSCYLICPGQVHLMDRNNSSGLVIQFTEECIQSTELINHFRHASFTGNGAVIFENRPDLFNDFNFVIVLLNKHLSRNDLATNHVASNLLLAFVSLIADQINFSEKEKDPERQLLLQFYILLEDHFSDNCGVQYYLDTLNINEKKLAKLTKRHLGLSPLQMIHDRILLEAKRLLLFEDTSHKEIAYKLGFDSPASFSAFIKLKTGLAPTQLTKQLAEIHK